MKCCSKCGISLTPGSFYASRPSRCKACQCAERKAHYSQNRQAVLASVRAYIQQNSEQRKAQQKQRYEREKARLLQQKRDYWLRNQEALQKKNAVYRAKNREALNQYLVAWREANATKVMVHREATRAERNAKTRERRRLNPHIAVMHAHKRRAAKLQAVTAWDTELDAFVIEEAAKLAQERQRLTGIAWHVDHAVPLRCKTASGLHNAFNLQVVPGVFNLRKGARLEEPLAWLAEGRGL